MKRNTYNDAYIKINIHLMKFENYHYSIGVKGFEPLIFCSQSKHLIQIRSYPVKNTQLIYNCVAVPLLFNVELNFISTGNDSSGFFAFWSFSFRFRLFSSCGFFSIGFFFCCFCCFCCSFSF